MAASGFPASSPAPDPETLLGDAIDLIVDGRQEEADALLETFVATLKAGMNGSDADAGRYYYWGRALALQEEWEQALLRYESALQVSPDHEASLREIVALLLDALDRPESAKTLLEQRLLVLKPGHPEYLEDLANAEALIRRRDGRPLREWKDGEEDAEGGEPAADSDRV